MALSVREKQVALMLMVICALFIFDRLALTPYLDRRSDLLKEKETKTRSLQEAQRIFRREKLLRPVQVKLDASLKGDPSETEGELLHLVREWEKQSGLSHGSFQRTRTLDDHGFTRLVFHLSASGPMQSVAALMYRVQTAPIPLRIDDVQVTPKDEAAGEALMVNLNLSTLCRQTAPITPRPQRTIALAGER